MVKFLFSFALFFLFLKDAAAQYALIKLKMDECVSCYNGLSYLDKKRFPLPVYAVFKSASLEDTADILYKFDLRDRGIGMLFSDSLYEALNQDAKNYSAVFVYNQDQKPVYKADIKYFRNARLLDSLQLKARPNRDESTITKWSRQSRVTLDPKTNKLRVYPERADEVSSVITAKDFDYDLLAKALKPEEREMFERVGRKISTESNMNARYTWYDIDSNGNIYCIMNYSNAKKTDDTTVMITDEFAIVKYGSDGKLIEVLPVYIEESSVNNPYLGLFFLFPDSGFVMPTHNWRKWFGDVLKEDPTTKIYPLTLFKKKGRELVFNKKLPLEFPYIHRVKYFENYLGPDFCQYPIAGFQLVNQLYNLETGDSVYLIPNKEYLQFAQAKGNSYNPMESDHNESFEVKGLGVEPVKKEVYTIYRVDSNYFFTTHTFDLKLKKQTWLPINGLPQVDAADVDVYSGKLYLRSFEPGRHLVLPLSLFQ